METWKPVKGYKDYGVSNYGNFVLTETGEKLVPHKQPELLGRNLTVSFHVKDKISVCSCQRLVARAFLENPYNRSFVTHLDGDVNNNHVNNLRWISQDEMNSIIENKKNIYKKYFEPL